MIFIVARKEFVAQVFSSIAGSYDLMNDLMSFGLHRRWKKNLIDRIPIVHNAKILDCAGGTGDIAFGIKKRIPFSDVVVSDINPVMLNKGLINSFDCNKDPNREIKWVCADAENLPFSSNLFDIYVISFGIRNVSSILKVLEEAKRMLKKGGYFFCLEFAPKLTVPFVDKCYRFYSDSIIPVMGKCVARDREAYEYLVNSIKEFPDQSSFCSMMSSVGFDNVSFLDFTLGVTVLYSARVS